MKISDKVMKLLISENFNKNDVVYISTENWNIMFDGNRSLKRFPSDDYMKKLKTFYVNKILGKVIEVYENGTIDVKFNQFTFGLKNEFVTKLSKGEKIPSPEKVVEEGINKVDDFKVGDRVIGVNRLTGYYNLKGTVKGNNILDVKVIFDDKKFNNGQPWRALPENIKKITESKYVKQLKFEAHELGQEVNFDMKEIYKELKDLLDDISEPEVFGYREEGDGRSERIVLGLSNNREYKKIRSKLIDFANNHDLNLFVNYEDGPETYFVVFTKDKNFTQLTKPKLINKLNESLDKLADQVKLIVKKMQSQGKVSPEEIANKVKGALQLDLTKDEIIKRYIRNNGGQFDSEF